MPAELKMHEWERLDEWGDTRRMRVPGGWLYRYADAMCFVPEPRVRVSTDPLQTGQVGPTAYPLGSYFDSAP